MTRTPLKIAHMVPRFPIIQGGMGVKVSLSGLAAAVANAGGIGTISGTGLTVEELVYHIRRARELTNGQGYIGVNVLFAMSDFAKIVKTAMEEKVDFIISGAGFSRDMYQWGKEYGVPIISIVSTAKLAKLAERLGASAIVVEGYEAGGHLGTDRPLFDILPEVIEAVKVPVIGAGGILTGQDIAKALRMGAAGVQLGTRFVASVECDAHPDFKQKYVDCEDGQTILVKTTVGLEGRAIRNSFTDRLIAEGKIRVERCDSCLKQCDHKFCTMDSLVKTVNGDVDNGIIFAGSRVSEIKEILPVQTIIDHLVQELTEKMNEQEDAVS